MSKKTTYWELAGSFCLFGLQTIILILPAERLTPGINPLFCYLYQNLFLRFVALFLRHKSAIRLVCLFLISFTYFDSIRHLKHLSRLAKASKKPKLSKTAILPVAIQRMLVHSEPTMLMILNDVNSSKTRQDSYSIPPWGEIHIPPIKQMRKIGSIHAG